MGGMTDTTAAPSTDDTARERLAAFRRRRAESVTAPTGNLALVATEWIDGAPGEGRAVPGVAGRWSARPAGESGLLVTAAASEHVVVDGETVDGEVVVRGRDDEHPSDVRFSDTVTGTVIAGEDGYALRVWDAESEAIRAFGSISAFDHDPSWVVTARFGPNPEGTTLGFEHLKDEGLTRELPVPGSIRFTRDGVDHDLAAFRSGRALQLVFADTTNGDTTYSVGRFLFVVPQPDGTIVLDFNLAVLPPCAFSYAFNCPMPPMQNRFAMPIEAGERMVLAKDGSPLH